MFFSSIKDHYFFIKSLLPFSPHLCRAQTETQAARLPLSTRGEGTEG